MQDLRVECTGHNAEQKLFHGAHRLHTIMGVKCDGTQRHITDHSSAYGHPRDSGLRNKVARSQSSCAGPGFESLDQPSFLRRGVPVERYTREEIVTVYWGFGLWWGKVVSQNAKGHIVGHVKNIGHDIHRPITRVYATPLPQPWHNDSVISLPARLPLT